ncbi:MAG: glycosyltransferase family 4 protein [Candidatus Rokubacteria bacterium]|nr:glycosyltransferase family 4 protein [Candidatus Rokubacteria bacterium]
MIVGVDASCWSNRRGYGRFTRELLRAMVAVDHRNEYMFFLDPQADAGGDLPEGATRIVVPTSEPPARAASASGRRRLADVWAFSRRVAREPLDVMFYPSVYTFFPLLRRVRAVVTIHDVIPERFPELVFPDRRSRFFWRAKLYVATRQASAILTVSEHSRAGILRYFRVRGSRVRVVHEAPSRLFRPLGDQGVGAGMLARYRLAVGDRYILYLGGMSPHKNLPTLLEVYARLVRDPELAEVKLVLGGDVQGDVFHSHYSVLEALVGRLEIQDRVTFAGFVEDEELLHLYNGADAVVLPSFDEGFGLPAIEAAACGVPVVASSTGALPELLEEAGLFVDPYRPPELLDALRRLLKDGALRKELGERGLLRAREFSWERSAAQVVALLAEVAGG